MTTITLESAQSLADAAIAARHDDSDGHLLLPLWRDPGEVSSQLRDLAGRLVWHRLTHLSTALSGDVGKPWLAARATEAPRAKDGMLPAWRRLWHSNVSGAKPIADSDEYLIMFCGDDGVPDELVAMPTTAAYAASRGVTHEAADGRLGEILEDLMDRCAADYGSTMSVGFLVNGERETSLDMG
jgi:hypothetical protein